MTVRQLLRHRFDALQRRDYAAVYASYHPDAPLRRQFADRHDYLDFAGRQLPDIMLTAWACRAQRRLDENRVECLLTMEMMIDGERRFFYECALLQRSDGRWLYHSAQKLDAADYRGAPEEITFADFDRVNVKIRL